jgi:hypothetical protein
MFIQWFVYRVFFFLFLKNNKGFRILAHPLICGIRFAEIQRACMKLLYHIITAIDITEDVQPHMNKCDNYVQYGTSAAVWECRRLLYTSVNLEIDIVLWPNEVINGRMWVIRLTYPPVQIWGLWLSSLFSYNLNYDCFRLEGNGPLQHANCLSVAIKL